MVGEAHFEGFLKHQTKLPWIVMPQSGEGRSAQFVMDCNAAERRGGSVGLGIMMIHFDHFLDGKV